LRIPLVGQGYQLRSPAVAAQSCLNLYPEIIQDPNEHAKNVAFLYGIPGRHVFSDLTGIDAAATPIRGIFTWAGHCFVAAGTKYMEISSAGTLIGSVYTISNATVLGFSNTPVQFYPNGNQLFIVSGGVGYIDTGSGPTPITIGNWNGTVNVSGSPNCQVDWVSGDKFLDDGSWVGRIIVVNGANYAIVSTPFPPTSTRLYVSTLVPIAVTSPPSYTYQVAGYTPAFLTGAYLNDSFFANQLNTRTANFSGVFDGGTWNGLNLISKDTWPDLVLCVLSNGSQMFMFGTDSFDVFQANPSSTTTFFSRIDGLSQRVGTLSPWSPIVIEGKVYYIGSGSQQGGPIAYVLDGFTPRRISQHGQEAVWAAAGLGPGCISYTYNEEGHTFWATNFGSQTWVFDTTTLAWHQRAAGSGFTAYPTAYHSYSPEFAKHLTGGPLDGKIYNSSVAFYDDAGQDIYCRHAIAYTYNARKRMYDIRLELEMETGAAPSGTPTIELDYSDDRGRTFSTPESASIGIPGAYSQRVFWPALGSSYERIYRFTLHGQGRVALIDAELEQEAGTD